MGYWSPYGWVNGGSFGVPNYQGMYSNPSQAPAQNAVKIPQVHGEEGAKAFSLPPNSSVLLMDETDAVIWAKVTDGAGYATLKGFRITPIEESSPESKEPKEEPIYVTTKEFDKLKEKVEGLIKELGGDKS